MNFFRRCLLPGFVFQGVTIGGGYATGRELVEFFMPAGPLGGLLGMAVTMVVFSAVLAASFELVRLTRSYDYKSFFTLLLGRGWVLFEVAYLLLLVIVMAVLAAAAGEIGRNLLGLPPLAGTLALMAVIGALLVRGNALVEGSTAAIALALYAAYVALIVWTLAAFGDRVAASFSAPIGPGWLRGGVTYAGYNLACCVAVFFCVRHARSRGDALLAGALAGPIAMLPGALLFVALMAFYPDIGAASVPSAYVLAQLGAPWFALLFQLVVFAALVSTGVPLLHAINERIAQALASRGRAMSGTWRLGVALGVMTLSAFGATAVGLVGLIAKGYGALTWAFIALLVVPVLTIGLWKIHTLAAAPAPARIPQT
jgi:uncharacterized membrane protein YkvI